MKERLKKLYWNMATAELEGIGIIEIILILVIIIGLILIFRTQITDIITDAFASINGNTTDINADIIIE